MSLMKRTTLVLVSVVCIFSAGTFVAYQIRYGTYLLDIRITDAATGSPITGQQVSAIYPGIWLTGMPDSPEGVTGNSGQVALRVSFSHNPCLWIRETPLVLDLDRLRAGQGQTIMTKGLKSFTMTQKPLPSFIIKVSKH